MEETKLFNADNVTIDNCSELIMAMEKSLQMVYAIQLNEPEGFELTTNFGKVQGQKGDILVIDKEGNKGILTKSDFEKIYDVVGRVHTIKEV